LGPQPSTLRYGAEYSHGGVTISLLLSPG